MGSQSDFMRHVSFAIVESRLFTIRAALAWIWFREFSAEGEQFPHTEIPYVTLGIIVLKYISSRTFFGRILILFNAPTFCVKDFFTESMCTDHVSLWASTIDSWLLDEDRPHGWQILETQPQALKPSLRPLGEGSWPMKTRALRRKNTQIQRHPMSSKIEHPKTETGNSKHT